MVLTSRFVFSLIVILSLSNDPTKKDTFSVHMELKFEVIRLWSPTVTTSHLTSSATFAGEKLVKKRSSDFIMIYNNTRRS